MILIGDGLRLSSRDLTGHVNCRHLTQLELQVARGVAKRPKPWDPGLEALWERGFRHERDFVQSLADRGMHVRVIEGVDVDDASVAGTLQAIEDGVDVIVQAALRSGEWVGRADVLLRTEVEGMPGTWTYEVYDTKLSRRTHSDTILQLCLYSDMLATMQGRAPEYMHVVAPWSGFVPVSYRVPEYSSYYRKVRSGLAAYLAESPATATYPHPNANCDVCSWRVACDKRRREDDHLSLVAGISSLQMAELNAHGISTVAALAGTPLPIEWQPARGSRLGLERVREQARVQVESRVAGGLRCETLPVEPGLGLAALPEPSAGDIYLDFEGDSFVGEHGQEYLLGYAVEGPGGTLEYTALWGLTREGEKLAFERFIDFVMERWQRYPDLHVYHYGGYESGALKRLTGRFATREEELDRILRGLLLVDLLGVVRHAIRAGVMGWTPPGGMDVPKWRC
jgi:uncharacterized protein